MLKGKISWFRNARTLRGSFVLFITIFFFCRNLCWSYKTCNNLLHYEPLMFPLPSIQLCLLIPPSPTPTARTMNSAQESLGNILIHRKYYHTEDIDIYDLSAITNMCLYYSLSRRQFKLTLGKNYFQLPPIFFIKLQMRVLCS